MFHGSRDCDISLSDLYRPILSFQNTERPVCPELARENFKIHARILYQSVSDSGMKDYPNTAKPYISPVNIDTLDDASSPVKSRLQSMSETKEEGSDPMSRSEEVIED